MEYASISRHLARFVDRLSYKDLPPSVIDRVKGRILHGVCTAFAGYEHPMVQAGKRLILNEEKGSPGTTTILGANVKASKLGAAFVNSMMLSCRNQHDSYRMLIHPSAQVLSSALAVAENNGTSGKDVLVGLAAGYEVLTRLASSEEYVLDAHAHGFRASPLFGVFGAAAATGKLMGLNEDQLRDALGFAATFAAGTAEGPRGGSGESMFQDAHATRSGIMASLMAQEGFTTTEQAIEGEAGFYNAFTGKYQRDYETVVGDLGKRFELLNITSKRYPCAGFNQLPIMLMARMVKEHKFTPDQITRIDIEMSPYETRYPHPQFARRWTVVGLIEYFVSVAAVAGDFPQSRPWQNYIIGSVVSGGGTDAAASQDLTVFNTLKKTQLHSNIHRPIYHPKITVRLKNGKVIEAENDKKELFWGVKEEEELAVRLKPLMGMSEKQLAGVQGAVRGFEKLKGAGDFLKLVARREAVKKA